ncbi:MAG: chemotaxis protein CheD [Planctomycetota bacterium]
MNGVVDVQIGQVKAVRGQVILKSSAIGSCIAVVACDPANNIAAMAHIMLPDHAPANKSRSEKTKYACDAIDLLFDKMAKSGSTNKDVKVVVLGGANVLQKEDDTICDANIKSTLGYLSQKNLEVVATAVGGVIRRNVWLDTENWIVSYSEGDGGKKQLWRWQ